MVLSTADSVLTRISHGFPTTTCCTARWQRLACFLLKQGVLTQHFVVDYSNLVTEQFTSSRYTNPWELRAKGRRSEDGRISSKYLLTETSSYRYLVRTRKNVEDSDGTVLFSISPVLTGGTLLTYQWAVRMNKPTFCIHANTSEPGSLLRDFLADFQIRDLNVAGPRRTT